jgi:glyoxylase-like metal-dependent hydrolase (beta-lactamase superfamily II)
MKYFLATLIFLLGLPTLQAQEESNLKITHLKGDFYVFTTYQKIRNVKFPSNGLYMVSKKGVLLIDTPWDTTQFEPLLKAIELKHKQKVVMCVATHFHEDRTGGFDFFRRQGIKTFSSFRTDSLAQAKGYKRAIFTFAKDTTFQVGKTIFQTYFAGEGHTLDNIVIWFPKQKILYGGCLVKSTKAQDLGFTGDAHIKAWRTTIENLLRKYPKTTAVITGHQKWDKREALLHTLRLLENK